LKAAVNIVIYITIGWTSDYSGQLTEKEMETRWDKKRFLQNTGQWT